MPKSPDLVAAVDLGSNSFHLVIGSVKGDWVGVVDRLRDPVQLGAGIDADGRLSDEAIQRMVESLERFQQRLLDVPRRRIRAIGTNTFRAAREPVNLLRIAEKALGVPIEVLSGAEEARLIYQGVCSELPTSDAKRLVVDIGGGSTEVMLGRATPIFTDSLDMGCVSFSRRFFPGGTITRDGFRAAETAAKLELETLQERFLTQGWDECHGSSGTINAVGEILLGLGFTDGSIHREAVKKLRKELVAAGRAERLALPGLQADRTNVIAGGVAILKATFDILAIERMLPAKAALREGLLHDLIGRLGKEGVRDRAIRTLAEHYHVDTKQADRVENTAKHAFAQVAAAWELDGEEHLQLLCWAARLCEIGLAISYSGHHKHGAYIIANTDLPGFSRQEQDRLALLVRVHRRKFRREAFEAFAPPMQRELRRLSVLLRVAVRLNRSRSAVTLPEYAVKPQEDGLQLVFPESWLDDHPLTRADLDEEARLLAGGGVALAFR
jgi:exopolyphosphatase/guanosine-5'-triphosphate,3'-diphosphate pyrophosphatase